jgi:uncharacterized protein involved in exopolysaccharide biosynthesis
MRRKGVLVAISLIGALMGMIVTLLQTPIYEARLSMEVQMRRIHTSRPK